MIHRIIFMLMLSFSLSLTAAPVNKAVTPNAQAMNNVRCCSDCNSCLQAPSAAQLLQAIEAILNNNLLLSPQLQPLLTQQLQSLIVSGGIGIPGPQGPTGATGATGATGTAGSIGDYLYVYNTSLRTVNKESDVIFDFAGLVSSGFTFMPETSQITVNAAGIYKVNFSVSSNDPNQFALFLNGVLVPGSIYGSGAGTQQNNGSVLVTVAAGQIITLRNHTSAASVPLQMQAGGDKFNANASVTILKLSSL